MKTIQYDDLRKGDVLLVKRTAEDADAPLLRVVHPGGREAFAICASLDFNVTARLRRTDFERNEVVLVKRRRPHERVLQ